MSGTRRRGRKRTGRPPAPGRRLRWTVTAVALVIGIGAGALTGTTLRSSDAVPSVAVPEPGDVVQAALTSFEQGENVHVAPGSESLLAPEAQAEVEEAIDEADAPLYVLVVRPTRSSGFRSSHQVVDQLLAYGPRNAVLVVWEGDGDGYLGFQRPGSLPPYYDLEEQGIEVTDPEAYGAVQWYEMVGSPQARLSEWARALPPGLADYRRQESDSDRTDQIAGAVIGVFAGTAAAAILIPTGWYLLRRSRRAAD